VLYRQIFTHHKESVDVPLLLRFSCASANFPFGIFHIYHISRAVFINTV